MIINRMSGFLNLCNILNIIISQIVFWLWFYLFNIFYSGGSFETLNYSKYALIVGLVFFGNWLHQGSRGELSFLTLLNGVARRAATLSVLVCVAILIYSAIVKDKSVSRLFIFSYSSVLFIVNILLLRVSPKIAAFITYFDTSEYRILFYGVPSQVFIQNCNRFNKLGFKIKIVGSVCIHKDCHDMSRYSFAVFDGRVGLEKIVRDNNINLLVVGRELGLETDLRGLVGLCDKIGIRCLILCGYAAIFGGTVVPTNLFGEIVYSLRQEPLENPINRICKRLFDIIISLVVIISILPPITLVVWFCQTFQSPGPIFYTQYRSGINTRQFKILKFRSMHLGNWSMVQQATESDPRVFKFGKIIRKFSIDEFPQFINVLFGHMSVVGPRPHLKEHDGEWAMNLEKYNIRSFVKPGITGLAQVRGLRGEARTSTDIRLRIESDIEYVENWTLLYDVKIVLVTVWQMVRPPKSAY